MLNLFRDISILKKASDGGKDSGVTAYWLIEWKGLFSVGFLRFSEGSREAYHSHAFNAVTWWLRGEVEEHFKDGGEVCKWTPSFKPKKTPRKCFHKVYALKETWALTFRGPWVDTWQEFKNGKLVTLRKGRIPV